MIFIATALYIEAKPIIEFYNLKKEINDTYFQIFRGDNIILIITGVGKINSSIAVSHMLTSYLSNNTKDNILNIGVCGTKDETIEIGSLCYINKITDNETKRNYYPDILFKHNFLERDIETFSRVVKNTNDLNSSLCDMEASGFFLASSKYLGPHRIHILKVVSDKLSSVFDKQIPYILIKNNIDSINTFIAYINEYFKNKEIFLTEEIEILNTISDKLKLTASQKNILYKKALHYKVRTEKNIKFLNEIYFKIPETKYERENNFAEILTYLR
ncbi:MAG: nucleoside phosphorylase [Minisyncoccia bacterium]